MPLPTHPSRDEGDLIDAVVDGSETAFRTLYDFHTPPLRYLARPLVGGNRGEEDDVVQETWIRAVRGLGRFRRDSTLRTWLIGVTIRVAREHLRRNGRWDTRPNALEPTQSPEPLGERLDLERGLARLPARLRTVVLLHDVEGLTHREIAGQLEIAVGSSKAFLSHGRRLLRDCLDGYRTEKPSNA